MRERRGADALVITSPESLIYLANFAPSPFVFNTVESAAALVLHPDRSILFGDNLLRTFLDRSYVDEVICSRVVHGQEVGPAAAALAWPRRSRSSVPSGAEAPHRGRESSRLLGLGQAGRSSSRSRHPETAAKQGPRRAGPHPPFGASGRGGPCGGPGADRAGDDGAGRLPDRPGSGDQGVLASRCWSTATSPPGRGARPSAAGRPAAAKIERGDLFLLDFSVVVHGYRADFTNTFVVGAEPTPRQIELYEICMGALEAGESLLRPGSHGEGDRRRGPRPLRLARARRLLSLAFSGMGWGWGTPSRRTWSPRATRRSSPATWSRSNRASIVPGVGGMRFERNYLITEQGPRAPHAAPAGAHAVSDGGLVRGAA